ncbi:glycosyltransferase [Pseudomonas fluorescens]|nr:glycosyltransferase [Pseudomonas fluorescens]MBK3484386.1 glycosyltransferase [Pseudomonas fluorescens]
MKIVLLSGASSIHTVRWANGLSAAGHEVHVVSQHPIVDSFDAGVVVHKFNYYGILGYFMMVSGVRKLLRNIKPDIVNAHYASGYGTTARLVNYHPWVMSVWGSDVYDFPYKSPLHKWLVTKNLKAADAVASTSLCMAVKTRALVPELQDIAITPFGVDMNAYSSCGSAVEKTHRITIGTVKTLAPKYGVDTLVKAFSIVLGELERKNPETAAKLILRLVGGGPQTRELQILAEKLKIADRVVFVGQIPHKEVPQELSTLDIYVALSRLDSESFGVAIIEAGAAGRPVVVSDAGGLPEVTVHGKTGLVVPRDNPRAAATAIMTLIEDKAMREQMGRAGREHVQSHYSWPVCIETMLQVYREKAGVSD